MNIKITPLLLILLCIVFIAPIKIYAKNDNNEDTNYLKLIETLTNEIGQENIKLLLEEINTEVLALNKITYEETTSVIKKITINYGIELSDTQMDIIYNHYSSNVESKTTLWEDIKNLFTKFINWFKSLYSKSEFSVKPVENESQDFIEREDNTVTINIPTVSQFDNLVDKVIDNVLKYFKQE